VEICEERLLSISSAVAAVAVGGAQDGLTTVEQELRTLLRRRLGLAADGLGDHQLESHAGGLGILGVDSRLLVAVLEVLSKGCLLLDPRGAGLGLHIWEVMTAGTSWLGHHGAGGRRTTGSLQEAAAGTRADVGHFEVLAAVILDLGFGVKDLSDSGCGSCRGESGDSHVSVVSSRELV